MLVVIIGLLLTAAVAVGIMYVVAVPHLRSGAELLTPDGKEVVERAREKALNTGEVMKNLGGRAKETLTPDGPKAGPKVGKPRSAPSDSGPIPVEAAEEREPAPAGSGSTVPGDAPKVIDLRESVTDGGDTSARHAR